MRPQAILFDVVGTLLHPEPSAATVYADFGQRYDSQRTRTEIRQRFREAFAAEDEVDRRADWRTSEEREFERWQRIVATVLDDVRASAACFAAIYQHFGRPDAWRCDPEAVAILAELSRRGCVLGLASNYDRRLHSVLTGLPVRSCLQHVFISSEIGWRKPALAFFQEVVRQLALPAGAILFVGDDRDNDYDGARAAGLGAVLLDPRRPGNRANR